MELANIHGYTANLGSLFITSYTSGVPVAIEVDAAIDELEATLSSWGQEYSVVRVSKGAAFYPFGEISIPKRGFILAVELENYEGSKVWLL